RMAESIMTPSGKTSPASTPRYSGWIGRLAASPIYAGTIGLIANSRAVRLTILLGVPLVWIAALHIGPIYQMLRISLLENYPEAVDGQNAYTLSNYRLFFQEPLCFVPFILTLIFAAI